MGSSPLSNEFLFKSDTDTTRMSVTSIILITWLCPGARRDQFANMPRYRFHIFNLYTILTLLRRSVTDFIWSPDSGDLLFL